MKSFRWTLVFGLLVAGLVVFTVYDYKRSVQQDELKSEESKLIRFKQDEIQKLEIARPTGTISLEKKDGEWFVTAPVQEIADQHMVLSVFETLMPDKSLATVMEGESLELARFGLDQPMGSFKFTTTDGRTEEIKIGTEKSYNSSLYAQIGSEPRVLMVAAVWESQLQKSLKELRNKNPYRGPIKSDFSGLEIREPGRSLVFEKDEKGWKLVKGGDGYPVSSDSVNAYIDQVKALRALDVISENKNSKGELARLSLTKPSLEIVLNGKGGEKSGDQFVLQVASASKDAGNVAVVSTDADVVFSVYKNATDVLRKKPEDFYDKRLPFKLQANELARIKLSLVGATPVQQEFVKKGGTWSLADSSASSALQNEVDTGKLNELATKLSRLEAVRFMKPVGQGQKAAPLKSESRVELLKESGEKLFEMSWGAPVMDKGTEEHPEVTYIPVRTSLSDRTVGVPEAMIKGLGLDQLTKPKAK